MVISGSDQTAPTFTRPPDVVIYTDQNCNYNASVTVTGDVTNESDQCSSGLNATYTDNIVPGSCGCSFIISRTWNLVDACGNAAPPQVQTITAVANIVTNTNDSGTGSLREVISCMPNGGTVLFASTLLGQTITLTSGEIMIEKNITIQGLGWLEVSGNMSSRIFQLMPSNTLWVKDIALKNGKAMTNGGAIFVKGHLILENVTLQNNFENTVRKAMTLNGAGSFDAKGTIQIFN